MSLFGYVANLVSNREDVATKGLHYILDNYPSGRSSMFKVVKALQHKLPEIAAFDAWPSSKSGQGRPDMSGISADGTVPLLLEIKLGAPLTDHQPATYLKQLPENGLLLFVVPQNRKESIVWELNFRLPSEFQTQPNNWSDEAGSKWLALSESKVVAVMSWERLLETLQNASAQDADPLQLSSDVMLLREFVNASVNLQGDFTPFKWERVSGREILEILTSMKLIVDAVSEEFKNLGWKNTCEWHDSFDYGFDFELNGISVSFGIYCAAWRQYGLPLWFGVKTAKHPKRVAIRQALSAIRRGPGSQLFQVQGDGDNQYVPVVLDTENPRDLVIDGAKQTLRELVKGLARL